MLPYKNLIKKTNKKLKDMNTENVQNKLRELVLNATLPIVIRNFQTNWKCLDETLEDWCKHFDDANNAKEIEFEKMLIQSKSGHPQWERERLKVKMSMKEFFLHKESKDHWFGLNYQTPDEIPEVCKSGVDFSCFGFPHLTNDFARFWLSTANANTPCHKDTYGCNIVVQAFGSKLWLLFPKSTPLTSTRLPYEESSIYCLENFYAPNLAQVAELKRFQDNAYICQLDKGDALIVPRHWWHFVETKTCALSINAWIPLDVDKHAQLEECLVKYIIETIANREKADVLNYMLNPNQRELTTEEDTLGILAYLAAKINSTELEKESKCTTELSYPYQYLNEGEFFNLLKEIPNANFVEKASPEAYNTLIANNSKRHIQENADKCDLTPISLIKETLINSICSEESIKTIVKEFLKRWKI